MLKIALLAALVALTSAHLKIKDCGANEIKWVDVTGCDGDAMCVIHKGKEITITGDFVANQDTKTAKIEIDASVGGISIPVPGIDTDGCKATKCPIVKGADQSFKYTITVPAIAPTIEADVTVKVVGESGKLLGCASVHGKIEN